MPADYDEIRAENIARYGWDTAVLDLLGHLYSDRTHFLFELIQNAEDAGATELTFELLDDKLEVRHDGRPFTPADVRGICGVAQGTKAQDLTQIGRFGIGFKSVYAYTNTPLIRSGAESFRIEKYVRPFAADAGRSRSGTVFVFPFDRPEVSCEVAVAEIGAALRDLDPRTLLFLRGIERISALLPGTAATVVERTSQQRGRSGRTVLLTSARGEGPGERRDDEQWLVWSRPLTALGEPGLRVELAFAARDDRDSRHLTRLESSPLVVSFPTEKETFLGFAIQGPYRTTPARDNVPEHDPWNQALVGETASLLIEILLQLRDEGLLTVDILAALPLDEARFPAGSMFRGLFDAARSAIVDGELIPDAAGGYRAPGAVRLPRGEGLRELLDPDVLGELVGAQGPVAFTDAAISESATHPLWSYLRTQAGVQEVTPTAVVTGATSSFLTARPDEWLVSFYGFLYQHQSLWRESAGPAGQPGPARAMPIIRLEDGAQVAPFDQRGRPAAYLPGPARTGYPTIRRAVAAGPGALRFLAALGFAEPDVIAEVLDHVLPRYDGADPATLDAARHEEDLELVARALAQAAPADLDRLLDQLRLTTFIVAENAGTGARRLACPGELYQRSKALEIYFDGNLAAWFAADTYGPWLAQLRAMGVRQTVEADARSADDLGYVVIADEFARNERGVAGFDPAARLDGLAHALAHPSPDRSEFVWNSLLVPSRHLIAGVVQRSPRRDFTDAHREMALSAIGELATTAAWLPAADGTFLRPAEADAESLPPSYLRDDVLAAALGMRQPVIDEANRQLGFPPGFLRRLSGHPDLVARIEEELGGTERARPREPR